ncbi:ribonuclease H-like domain-containing protein [Tanacetum coccineum]
MAQRLQAEEQEELCVEENAKLFQQLLKQRRKHFAAKNAEEERNKPPTQAQQRKIICSYLKNMEGKSFDSIQKMFDRALKRVNTFVDFRTDLMEGSSKKAGQELEQESTKKQKVDKDKYTEELQSLMEVILDEEEVAIDVYKVNAAEGGNAASEEVSTAEMTLRFSASHMNSRIRVIMARTWDPRIHSRGSYVETSSHSNLVTLTRYYTDGDQRLLVYEYMPHGSRNNYVVLVYVIKWLDGVEAPVFGLISLARESNV